MFYSLEDMYVFRGKKKSLELFSFLNCPWVQWSGNSRGLDALNRIESMAVPNSISHHQVKCLRIRSAPLRKNKGPSVVAISAFIAQAARSPSNFRWVHTSVVMTPHEGKLRWKQVPGCHLEKILCLKLSTPRDMWLENTYQQVYLQSKPKQKVGSVLFCFVFESLFTHFEKEREHAHVHKWGRCRERENHKQAPLITGHNVGLSPMALRSRPEPVSTVRRVTDWATQEPQK